MSFSVSSSYCKRGFANLANVSMSVALLVAICATGFFMLYLSRQRTPVAVTRPVPSPIPTPRTFTAAKLADYIEQEDVAGVQECLDAGVSPNESVVFDFNALTWAAYHGKAEMFPLLLAHGAKINAYDDTGFTALTSLLGAPLSEEEAEKYVKWLCRHGADVNLPSKHGDVPLVRAAEEFATGACKVLLAYGAKVNAHDKYGNTALYMACGVNSEGAPATNPAIVRMLLEHGADPNLQNKDRVTPLLRLCQDTHFYYHSDDSIVSAGLLLAHGADLNLQDKQGRTALQVMQQAKCSICRERHSHNYAFLKQYVKRHPHRSR